MGRILLSDQDPLVGSKWGWKRLERNSLLWRKVKHDALYIRYEVKPPLMLLRSYSSQEVFLHVGLRLRCDVFGWKGNAQIEVSPTYTIVLI